MKFSKKWILIPILAGITLVSCQHDPPDISQTEPVCFQKEVLPIFQNSCGTCHSSVRPAGGRDLTSYTGIMKTVVPFDAAKSAVYKVIRGMNFNLMPPSGPLPADARTKIWLWIQQGAQETTCGTDTSNGTPGVAYTCFSRDILPVLSNSCAMSGCHNASSAKEGVVITSYQTLMTSGIVSAGNPANSKLYRVITASSGSEDVMPPKPYSVLSKAVTDSIYKWIQRGAKNEVCASVCDTTGTMTYAVQIQPIIAANCQSCHSGTTPSGGIKLTTYTEVFNATKNGKLISSIKRLQGVAAMPPSVSLSTCNIRKIELWKNQNYPQ